MSMDMLYLGMALFLLLTLVAGLWRVLRGPTAADRMLAAQLFGTTAVASLLLLAQVLNLPPLRDVALVFALLAAVTAVAFVRRAWVAGLALQAESWTVVGKLLLIWLLVLLAGASVAHLVAAAARQRGITLWRR